MKIVKQLAIPAANKTGTLSKIIEVLAEGGVNIVALAISESLERGIIRLVVDRPEEAAKLLIPEYEIRETDVLQVDMPNQPGSLAAVTAKLGVADINIEYIYASAGASGGQTTVIIKVADLQKAMVALA
jgi:hypothetical protein